MTTLPQTTGGRFPRVGARTPSIPALAQPGGGGGAAAAANASTMGLADVLRVLRANSLLIIICLILSLVAGWAVNDYVFEPYMKEYKAQANLQVQLPTDQDPTVRNVSVSIDRGLLEVRQKTLAQKLQSPDLWRPLLQNERLLATPWFTKYKTPDGGVDQAELMDVIGRKIGVNPVPQTELIAVTLAGPTPTDARVVLEAIVDRLIQLEQGDISASQGQERTTLATLQGNQQRLIDSLQQQMNASNAILSQGRDANGNGNGIGMVRQIEMSQLVAKRIEQMTDFNKVASEYDLFIKQADAGITPAIVEQAMSQNPTLLRLTAQQDEAETYLLTSRNLNGDNHRQTIQAQASVDALSSIAAQKRDDLRVSTTANLKDMLSREAASKKADYDNTVAQIQNLERVIGEINIEQGRFNSAENAHKAASERMKQINERIQVIDAVSTNSARNATVKKWGTIEDPKLPSFPNLKMTLGVAGLLGLGLSVGIAFLRELMDTSVRSPRDIMRVGQLNLLGMIPHSDDDPQAAAGDLNLIISNEPHSIISENFRQVRTRLQHTASLDTTRSLLITSPSPGDGKTTVACNIAAGLALNGRKILLVDANFRRPELHKVFGVANDTGLGSVLSQASTAESAIKKTNVPNLDVLPTGPRPANTTELLESQLLTDFIDRSLEEYDHVIFDAGPILLVSETVALAPRVDGVVTVVRARANSRGLLQRMRDALRQLKAEHLGVVLNGVRQHSGGYYARNIKNYYAYQNGNH